MALRSVYNERSLPRSLGGGSARESRRGGGECTVQTSCPNPGKTLEPVLFLRIRPGQATRPNGKE